MTSRLERLAIDTSYPGFYDDPAFLAAEAKDPTLLDAYAGYIDAMAFDAAYLSRAREIVVSSSAYLHDLLVRDGRKGACIDASQMLSRFLEQQGIWNYILKGGTAIYPAPHTGLEPAFHWVYDSAADARSAAPHAWICAPPFRIVDLTLGQQEGAGPEERYLRKPVVAEYARPAEPRIDELFDPPIRAEYRRQLGRPVALADLRKLDRKLTTKLERWGTWQVDLGDVSIRYTGIGVTAPDAPFEQARGWRLNGKTGWELWLQFKSEL